MTARLIATIWVEDDESGRRFTTALEQGGFTVERVVAEDDLVKRARRSSPAIILLDLEGPNGSAWRAVQRLQATEDTCEIPVIAVSPSDLIESSSRMREAGFCGVVDSRIGEAALLSAVRYCITRAAAGADWVDLSAF